MLLGVNIWDLASTSTNAPELFFNNMLRVEHYSVWFNTLMTGCTLLYILLMGDEIRKVGSHVAEYFTLIFFILCGLYLLSTYNNLLMLFIGIEILSIPQYILAGSDKRNLKSSEASLEVLPDGCIFYRYSADGDYFALWCGAFVQYYGDCRCAAY